MKTTKKIIVIYDTKTGAATLEDVLHTPGESARAAGGTFVDLGKHATLHSAVNEAWSRNLPVDGWANLDHMIVMPVDAINRLPKGR